MITLRDFEPLEQVGDDGKVSFRARSRATGAPLIVHLFRGTSFTEGTNVIAQLSALPEAERSRILDFGQEHGAVFFLTQDLPGNMGFPEWLNSVLRPGQSVAAPRPIVNPAPAKPAQPPPTPKNPPSSGDQGEFTRFYNRRAEVEPDSGSNTTEDFDGFYGKDGLYGKKATARNSPQGNQDPMEWCEPPTQRAPGAPAGGRAINRDAKNQFPPIFAGASERTFRQSPAKSEFQPIFAPEASPPARAPDRDRHRVPDRRPRIDVSRTPPRAPLGPALKPLLLTLGIILGVALIVVLVMRVF